MQSNLRRKKFHRTNHGSNFLGGSFSNRENVRIPIQFRRESQPQYLKRSFFLKKRPIIFTSIAPVLLDWSNKTSWVFPALTSKSNFLPSPVSRRLDSSSEANFKCRHRSDVWPQLEYTVVLSAQIAILQITLSGSSLMDSRKSVGQKMEPW